MSTPAPASSERRRVVLAALDAEPGLRIAELAAATGLDLKRLAPLLWRMEEDGQVVHEGRRWFVAP